MTEANVTEANVKKTDMRGWCMDQSGVLADIAICKKEKRNQLKERHPIL